MNPTLRSFARQSADGLTLAGRTVAATSVPPRATFVGVHGYCEHGGRYLRLAEWLAGQGYDVVLSDLRGHGHSEGRRGHVRDLDEYAQDVAALLAVQPSHQPLFLFGHSLGGLIALRVARQLSRPLCGLLLSNPYLANAMPIPAWKRWLGRLAARLYPTLRAPAGIKRQYLSRDPQALSALDADPLVFNSATAGWFAAVQAAQQAECLAGPVGCPVWLGVGTADPMAWPQATLAHAERLAAPGNEVVRYEGALHELLHDLVRTQVMDDMAAFMARCLARS